jgi:membrane protein YdbS with pleckstrin-like domain
MTEPTCLKRESVVRFTAILILFLALIGIVYFGCIGTSGGDRPNISEYCASVSFIVVCVSSLFIMGPLFIYYVYYTRTRNGYAVV